MRLAPSLVLLVAACASNDVAVALRTAGILATPTATAWTRIDSDEGWSLELPGVPRAVREDFRFAGERIRRTLVDCDVEAGLGGYFAYVHVATPLDGPARERLRLAAEQRVTTIGDVVGVPHDVAMAGTHAAETFLTGTGIYARQRVVVRSLVLSDLVLVLAVLSPSEGTHAANAERYFASLSVRRTEPGPPRPPSS